MKFEIFSDEHKCKNVSYWNLKATFQCDVIISKYSETPKLKYLHFKFSHISGTFSVPG
jgi:hypothetical protein